MESMNIRFDNTQMKKSIEDARIKIPSFLDRINNDLYFIYKHIRPKLSVTSTSGITSGSTSTSEITRGRNRVNRRIRNMRNLRR
tara:strand:+ start:1387 stop:1638 length:252 start_codon:yes stop_codon:yes gene_type:complete